VLLPLMDKDMAGPVRDRPFFVLLGGEWKCLAESAESAEIVRLRRILGHTESTESTENTASPFAASKL